MIKTGDKLPHFELPDQEGRNFSISELIGKDNLVIYFYPKNDTAGCTAEACGFNNQYEDFSDLGAIVIGISADDPESHKNFRQKYNLKFTLLSDSDNRIRKLFGVPGNLFGLIPGRVTYVADKNGVVRYIINSQLNTKKHIEEALAGLRQLNKL